MKYIDKEFYYKIRYPKKMTAEQIKTEANAFILKVVFVIGVILLSVLFLNL